MRRDFDLVRAILADVANQPAGQWLENPEYPEYNAQTIAEHVELMAEAGLLKAKVRELIGAIRPDISIERLTWEGQDFLDAARDDTLWRKARETVLKPGLAITFDLLKEWLKRNALPGLGLS